MGGKKKYNRTSETEHHSVMGRKKKYIEMFGSFTEVFKYTNSAGRLSQ